MIDPISYCVDCRQPTEVIVQRKFPNGQRLELRTIGVCRAHVKPKDIKIQEAPRGSR